MPSMLLIVFVVQVAIHIVNTVGAATISSLLWTIWNKLPTSSSADYKNVTQMRREVVRLKRELNATSPQDQFARWAKLQRQYDKAVAEHDQKAQGLQAFETSFNSSVSALRWIGTKGLVFVMQFWFGNLPMFWLPRGWVPGYVEWLLAFPKAPTGSISIQVWFGACVAVVSIVSAAIASVWALVIQSEMKQGTRGEPVAMGAAGGGEKGTSGGTSEKKEL